MTTDPAACGGWWLTSATDFTPAGEGAFAASR